jgi:hypothetical protein
MSDTKPPVEKGDIVLIDIKERGAWVPAETVADLEAELDKCKQERRGLLRRIRDGLSALYGDTTFRRDDFDDKDRS